MLVKKYLVTHQLFQLPPYILHTFLSRVFPRYITILSPEDPTRNVAGKPEDGVDLRTLRAIRVLRPLKLVSGVPSKCMIQTQLNLSSQNLNN